MKNHEIDYVLHGDDMQFVEIQLDKDETVVAEAGNFMMMDDLIQMETIFGDGSQNTSGVMNKFLGAGKRMLTGESLFMTAFTNTAQNRRRVFFAAPYPGKIIPLDLSTYKGKIICQKQAFLAAAKGVSVGIEFQKKLGVGFFGGEGFIMQKIEGDGIAFVHAGGTVKKYTLQPGEKLRVDTGCLVAMTQDVHYNIEFVKGIKTALFGGEGIFFATLEGPGTVWVQSMPFNRLASRVFAAAPTSSGGGGKSMGESGVGNLFNLFSDD